jgi:hypothetical protein
VSALAFVVSIRIHQQLLFGSGALLACAVMRAMECDCAAAGYCAHQPDLADAIDARIRSHLAAGRSAEQIYLAEAGDSIVRPAIERWANGHADASPVDRARLKYRGAKLPDFFFFSAFDGSVKVAGVCIGADKLGHFFQQGWECYVIAVRDQQGEQLARSYAEWLEGVHHPEHYAAHENYFRRQRSGRFAGYGGFGRNISGVISHADVAASCAGVRFYRDLADGNFKTIRDYVTADWCEETNRNDYNATMKRIVERNGGR